MNRRIFLRSLFRGSAVAAAAPLVTPAIIESLTKPKIIPFWYQSSCRTRYLSEEYKKVFARLMEQNAYWRGSDLGLRNRYLEGHWKSS